MKRTALPAGRILALAVMFLSACGQPAYAETAVVITVSEDAARQLAAIERQMPESGDEDQQDGGEGRLEAAEIGQYLPEVLPASASDIPESEIPVEIDSDRVILPVPEREGFRFLCWSEGPDMEGACYAGGEIYVLRRPEDELYANWEETEEVFPEKLLDAAGMDTASPSGIPEAMQAPVPADRKPSDPAEAQKPAVPAEEKKPAAPEELLTEESKGVLQEAASAGGGTLQEAGLEENIPEESRPEELPADETAAAAEIPVSEAAAEAASSVPPEETGTAESASTDQGDGPEEEAPATPGDIPFVQDA